MSKVDIEPRPGLPFISVCDRQTPNRTNQNQDTDLVTFISFRMSDVLIHVDPNNETAHNAAVIF